MFFRLLFERFIIFILGSVRRNWGNENCFFEDCLLNLFLFNCIVFKFVKDGVIIFGNVVKLLFEVIRVLRER